MSISFKDITRKYKHAVNEVFFEKINYHDSLVRELDGYWTMLNTEQTMFANVFSGENLITENNEGYVNIFIPELRKDSHSLDVKKIFQNLRVHCEFLEKNINPKLIYFQLLFEKTSDFIIRDMINLKSNFNLISCVVKKNIREIDLPKIDTEFTIRAAQPYDVESIFKCLENAYINGTELAQYSSIGLNKFKQNIRKHHHPLLSDKNLILIAEKNKEFCGHITFNLDEGKNFLDGKSASLIDVFVLDKFKKLGLEQILTKSAEIECGKRRKYNLIGTMQFTGSANEFISKLNNLNKNGWDNDSVIFSKIN